MTDYYDTFMRLSEWIWKDGGILVADAANRLGISIQTLHNWIKNNELLDYGLLWRFNKTYQKEVSYRFITHLCLLKTSCISRYRIKNIKTCSEFENAISMSTFADKTGLPLSTIRKLDIDEILDHKYLFTGSPCMKGKTQNYPYTKTCLRVYDDLQVYSVMRHIDENYAVSIQNTIRKKVQLCDLKFVVCAILYLSECDDLNTMLNNLVKKSYPIIGEIQEQLF